MSEYQYYEFQAIDHPIGKADREILRELSTRAQITANSFTNSYNYGDFGGNPDAMMEHWFDLHLYLANWGSRRLMVRWPIRVVDHARISAMVSAAECATVRIAGDHVILDIELNELEGGDWANGEGWLTDIAPLRADVLDGDLRLLYLAWLIAIEFDDFAPDATEPMPGIGPLTPALETFAEFFYIDPDLLAAAAEHTPVSFAAQPLSSTSANRIIAAMTDGEKADLLLRLYDGTANLANELRAHVRQSAPPQNAQPPAALRTVAQLQTRAAAIRDTRARMEIEQAAAEQRQRDEAARQAALARIEGIRQRGESVWREIDAEVERRNGPGYDTAANLLRDLRTIAQENGTTAHFVRRVRDICAQHAAKKRFIERLEKMGMA